MDAEGGDVELSRHGHGQELVRPRCLHRCIRALAERDLRPEYRLDAALAMSQHGAFSVVATPDAGPYVLRPPMPGVSDLAA